MARIPEPKNGSIKVTIEDSNSFRAKFVKTAIKPFRPHLVRGAEWHDDLSPELEPPDKITAHNDVIKTQVGRIWQYLLKPRDDKPGGGNSKDASAQVYYFCGGGFHYLPSTEHWHMCAELARRLQGTADVYLVSPPLTPHSNAPKAMPPLYDYFRLIREQAERAGRKVILAGDSSGAHIALGIALNYAEGLGEEEAQSAKPLDLMLICPPTDFRNENPDIDDIVRSDPILTKDTIVQVADDWRGEWDVEDTRLTFLLHQDIASLKRAHIKIYGILATRDVLYPDAALLVDMLDEHMIQGNWFIWDGGMHCYPLMWFAHVPESARSLEWMVECLRRASIEKK